MFPTYAREKKGFRSVLHAVNIAAWINYSFAVTKSHSYQMLWPETNERDVIQFWNHSSELRLEIIVLVTASINTACFMTRAIVCS